MEWLSGPKEKLVLAHGEFIISEKVVALYHTSLPRRTESKGILVSAGCTSPIAIQTPKTPLYSFRLGRLVWYEGTSLIRNRPPPLGPP